MSTKIYYGFKAVDIGIKDLMNDLESIKKEVQQIATKLALEHQLFEAVLHFDQVTLGEAEQPKSSYFGKARAHHYMEQREVEKTNERNMSVDYSFEIALYPLSDTEFLGIYYTDWDSKYTPFLTSKPWWREYGYWNNSDKPDCLTDEEWEERKLAWDFIPWGTPTNEVALTYKLQKTAFFTNWPKADDDIELLSFASRVNVVVKALLHKEIGDMKWSEYLEKDKAGEFNELKQRLRTEVESKLVKDLTLEMLLKEPQAVIV